MPIVLKEFQQTVRDGILARLRNVRALHDQVRNADPSLRTRVRREEAAVVLQAPTGAGKTAIACAVLSTWASEDRVLWFWFAPFAGLVEQARETLRREAPKLALLDFASDRSLDSVLGGGIFVSTWSAVAASNANARKARTRGDGGLSLDELILQAREAGLRIGCVVDEAHHGFHKAAQARRFFTNVLAPDYALMMTATPRDRDVAAFAQDTGYRSGDVGDWASVSRFDAVESGLLKRGVRVVRFLARDGDTRQLVDFEHLALRECAQAHRQIKATLSASGVALTPLMLVQVPDGKAAQQKAAAYLVDTLGFAADSVRVHTADEPDPDLIALANDPTVEVLIFKMAVALGFDAPRAFTLTALRGARDPSFGVQVIGRIVRVHALLQGRGDLPDALDYGYVFLANAESQEGLLSAGEQINTMRTQAPEIGTSVVLTVSGSRSAVQVVASGEPMALMLGPDGEVQEEDPTDGSESASDPAAADAARDTSLAELRPLAETLFGIALAPSLSDAPGETGGGVARAALAIKAMPHRYPRRAGVPASLRSEWLPKPSSEYELRLADHIEFNATVLADRIRGRAALQRRESDVFQQVRDPEDERDIWAELSAEAVADRANDLLRGVADVHEREFRQRILERFSRAIEASGAATPDPDELEDQLDLVLVRNPRLLRDAYRRVRQSDLRIVECMLPGAIESELPLQRAQRNAYGVFPADLNEDELRIAQMLDGHALVEWWHRNPVQRPESVALYGWDEGDGFFPDFVVSVQDRQTTDRIALLEVKGNQLWGAGKEPAKADAVHPDYGKVFMAGRKRGESDFVFLRRLESRLESDGPFSIDRMRW